MVDWRKVVAAVLPVGVVGLAAVFPQAMMTGCSFIAGAQQVATEQVAAACAAPEIDRKATRDRLSSLGLYVHCVSPGTDWDAVVWTPPQSGPAVAGPLSRPPAP